MKNLFTAIRNLVKRPDTPIPHFLPSTLGKPDHIVSEKSDRVVVMSQYDIVNSETKIVVSKHCKQSNRKVSGVFLIPVYKDGRLIENMEFSTGTRIKI